MPAVVRPADSGRWFGSVAKLGQMAVIILGRSQRDCHSRGNIATYTRDTSTPIASVDAKPEHGQNSSAYNSKIAKPIAEARSRCNRERDVQVGTNGAVEHSRYSIAEAGDEGDEYSISGSET